MAWSPPAHNAGIVWVSAPADYATFNSNHTPDGTTAAARKLPSLAMATTASSSTNPLLYIVAIPWIRHRSLSQLSRRSKSVMVQQSSMTQGGWNAQSPYHQHHLRHHDARLPRIRSPGS